MTRRRDRYRGQINDFGDRGVMPACDDLYAVLCFFSRFAEERGLLNEYVRVRRKPEEEFMTVGALLAIAKEAYVSSIGDASFVYRQLLENAEAADALVRVFDFDGLSGWRFMRDALYQTLDRRPIAKRGLVNVAKRELAAREAER